MNTLQDLKVYPNPVHSQHDEVIIDDLSDQTMIKITELMAQCLIVFKQKEEGIADGRDECGKSFLLVYLQRQ